MINLFLRTYLIPVQITVAFLTTVFRGNDELRLSFLRLLLGDDGVELPNTHASDFNDVGWVHVAPANSTHVFLKGIVDLSAQLRILIQVRNVGL
jgi:hypothetical protein